MTRKLTTETPPQGARSATATRQRMRVADVEAAFKDTAYNTFYEATTDTFIAAFFPASNRPAPADILSQLKESGCYDAGKGRWANFPDVINNEKELYKPFAATANAIVGCLKKVQTQITYLDRHSVRPLSRDVDMPAGRPDGVGVNFDNEMIKLDKEIAAMEASVTTVPRALAQQLEQDLKDTMKELRSKHKVWWRGIHVPYEIKLNGNWDEAIEQLVVYMCHMLMEQLDRRFVLGMVLCLDELKVVLCDRSGILSTKTSFNIHKEPEKFIQIIAGFSLIDSAALGWDTDMKIYDIKSQEIKPSYEMVSLLTNLTRYELHWVIDVGVEPSSESNARKVKQYISVSTISALRASEICTRATVVFEVVEFEKRFNPTETLALKRYWRRVDDNPGQYPHEGKIYNMLDEDRQGKLPHMVTFEDIEIGSRKDETLSFVRHGIGGDLKTRDSEPPATRSENDLDANLNLHTNGASADVDQEFPPLINRQHVNILMPMGETFKGVCSLKELLICFEDYVRDHRHAHDRSILHRDISSGNLLIFENEDGPFGRLIDYDHAKYTEDSTPAKHSLAFKLKKKAEQRFLREFHDELRRQQVLADKIKTLQEKKENKKGAEDDDDDDNDDDDDDDDKDRFKPQFTVEDEVALKAYEFILDPLGAATYVYNVIARQFPNTQNQVVLNKADLGWEHEHPVEHWPSYEDRQPRMAQRTGTVPYMSTEVISQQVVLSSPPFVHQAIHDMESLFWVLVHTCITRKGPGFNQRRDFDPHSKQLNNTVLRYFDNDNDSAIAVAKRALMMIPEYLEDRILAHFHPAYDALKPLVRKWWTILLLGYKYKADEFYNIHSHILRILKETNILDDDTDLACRLREQRKQRKQHQLDTFKFPTTTTPTTFSSGPPLSQSQSLLQDTPAAAHQSVALKLRTEVPESPLRKRPKLR